MKIHVLLVVLVLGLTVSAARAQSDVDIHATAKMATPNQPLSQGHRAIVKESWTYDITVENKRFQPLTGLEVRYIVFFTTAKLASKDAPLQQHESGSFSIEALRPHERKGFATTAIELDKSHLVGRRHFTNYGRMKSQDSLVGVWVRVYQRGRIVGEYANPSTLMKEQWQ